MNPQPQASNSTDMFTRVALWCAPSATPCLLLRAFEQRADCVTSDEPLAAAYLAHSRRYEGTTGSLSLHDLDLWNETVERLRGEPPVADGDEDPPTLWVQKHMAKQLLLHTSRDWLEGFRHVFVLRDPRRVIAESITADRPAYIEDTSVPHQLEIYRWVMSALPGRPIVLRESTLLADPGRAIVRLCAALGVTDDPVMARVLMGATPANVQGDACWYEDSGHLTRAATQRLAAVEARYGDLVRRCRVMQRELLESELRGVCSTAC